MAPQALRRCTNWVCSYEKDGYACTANSVIDYFMRSIAFRNNWATYHGSELTSEQGRAIPYMFLTQPSDSTLR